MLLLVRINPHRSIRIIFSKENVYYLYYVSSVQYVYDLGSFVDSRWRISQASSIVEIIMRLPRRLLGVQQLVNKWFLSYETPYHDREALKLPRTVVKITREKAWREIALKLICYSHFVLVTSLSVLFPLYRYNSFVSSIVTSLFRAGE